MSLVGEKPGDWGRVKLFSRLGVETILDIRSDNGRKKDFIVMKLI
jgi:hypothetical protein